MENLESLDALVHRSIYVHVVTMRTQDYNDGTHYECMTNYGFTHVSFVRNVAYVRFFSSRACEFLSQGKFC